MSVEHHDRRWTWEAKSVNGRSLDIRIKVPYGYDRIELPAKKLAGDRLARGSISFTLSIETNHANSALRINRLFLDELIELHGDFANRVDANPLKLETLLTVKGVIESAENDETSEELEQTDAVLLSTLDEAIKGLASSRLAEGERLSTFLADCLTTLEVACRKARKSDGARIDVIRDRLNAQIAELLDRPQELAEERFAQEVAVLATKADVREELDRLEAHCAAGRELLAGSEPIGRRLDFLCQEFNREANTLCSKSSNEELTRIGLEMKATIDQLREQAQNVE